MSYILLTVTMMISYSIKIAAFVTIPNYGIANGAAALQKISHVDFL